MRLKPLVFFALCVLTACSASHEPQAYVPVEFVNCDAPKAETPLHATPIGQTAAAEDGLMLTTPTSKDEEEAEMQRKIDHLSRMKRARKTHTPEFQQGFSQLQKQKTPERPVTRYVSAPLAPSETTVAQTPLPKEPKIDEDEIDIIED